MSRHSTQSGLITGSGGGLPDKITLQFPRNRTFVSQLENFSYFFFELPRATGPSPPLRQKPPPTSDSVPPVPKKNAYPSVPSTPFVGPEPERADNPRSLLVSRF